ncbi:MAG TPA: carboxypeptidase-like regulatory domain-containing protein, partial [Nitrospira sp.]|nr:carboxypeptidase-like regulatory domain-containing protein [Nitrospira sp.]
MISYHSGLARGVRAGCRAWACLITIVIGLLLSACPAAVAQSIFANLSGTVTDSTGGVVPGVRVLVENEGTKVVRQVLTDKAGFFSVTQLPVGTYSVTADTRGYEKWKGSGIVLQSGDEKSLSITLKVGAETETVTVIADSTDLIMTDSGAKADHIDTDQLEHLALVGRNAMEFLKILPGAAQISNGGTNRPGYNGQVVGINGFTVQGGAGAGALGGVSINGQSGTGMSINQDGQSVEDPGAPGSA